MARYVLSHRRAGIFDDSEKVAVREQADRAFSTLFADSVDLIGKREPQDETKREVVIFDASPTEVASKRGELGDKVLLEPEILHFRKTARPLDLVLAHGQAAGEALAGSGRTLRLTLSGPSGPLVGAETILYLRGTGSLRNELKAVSDSAGQVAFDYGPSWLAAVALVLPAGEHWSMIVRGPADGMTVELSELPATAPVSWWQKIVGVRGAAHGGSGVTVGVADTGLGPHSHLGHAQSAGAYINGVHHEDPDAGKDVDSHGTHVCGTIGALPPAEAKYAGGIAPGADLFCVRVFPTADDGANQGDIASAIEHLSKERRADLINLSLGAGEGSEIERDAIADALERGTLCVCAAGNSGGPVEYPAAFEETVGVSALGLEGWGAPGSLSATRYPEQADRYGADNLFLANFSCFGSEVDCGAPGVGIIATVPERHGLSAPYAAMDGTSMASPVACATLAAALSASPEYLGLPRDLTRSAQARAVLGVVARDIGLATDLQGKGVPQAAIAGSGI
jgi:subtilisin family serine protease